MDNVTRFLEIASMATSQDQLDAIGWYADASKLAEELTDMGYLTFDQSCCIIATFSIRQRWVKNGELARRFASGERDLPVMSAINRIADNVVSFDDPYSALNGDKTNAFAHNIANDVMAVTLDVWMIRAVGGNTKQSLGKKAYRDLANDLREAAMIYGMVPSHFQALIWILVRGSSQ